MPLSALHFGVFPQTLPVGQIWPFEQMLAPAGATHE